MTHTTMSTSSAEGEQRESTSSDFPAELSAVLSPTALSDIEIDIDDIDDIDDDDDSIFTDSPLSSSDHDIYERLDMQYVAIDNSQSKQCVMLRLEKIERNLRQLEEMLKTQQSNIEEVEKETKDSKSEKEIALCQESKQNTKNLQDIHSPNIWQFIRTCLDDVACDKIIRYTDKTRKTEFLIKDPEKFAAKWGKLKNKESMTVRKLSRSLGYLVKTKKKLKKVSKWKFQIEDSSVDFVCSRVNSPWGSSSDNTVDLQYEMDQLSPEINDMSTENMPNSQLINNTIKPSATGLAVTSQHSTFGATTTPSRHALHDNITSHDVTLSTANMATMQDKQMTSLRNVDAGTFILSQGSPISNGIKTIVNTLVTKGAFHSYPPLLALTTTTTVDSAVNIMASLAPRKCLSPKSNDVVRNIEVSNDDVITSPPISYCVNPPLYVNSQVERPPVYVKSQVKHSPLYVNSRLDNKQLTDFNSANTDINMTPQEDLPTYEIATLFSRPVENPVPIGTNIETVLTEPIPLNTELAYSVPDVFGLNFGLNYPDDGNNNVNSMSDFSSFNDFATTLFDDISSSLLSCHDNIMSS